MTVRTLAVWCPDWPVVAAGAAAGVPPQRPAAVVAANLVLACSATARADGVRRGLRKREAQARCPELAVLDHDPDRDARAFEPVVCAVEALAPGVEVVRPGLVVVAARGPVSYFGSEPAVAERTIDLVGAQAGVECQVGAADGIFAAILAAYRGVLVAPGQTPAFLAPLKVTELLRLTGTGTAGAGDGPQARGRAELVGLLRRLGLRTLGAFAALPVRDVASRFGPAAVLAHRLAGGLDETPLVKRQAPVDLSVVQRLDPPVERVDAAAFAAREPAARLHELLAGRGLACTRLQVHAETEHGEQLVRTWRCAEPLTPNGINDRVRWQLDAWVSAGRRADPAAPSAGIVLLRLVPDEVVPVGALQRGLWDDTGEGDERAARSLVRVQGLLGPEAVYTAVLDGGRGPGQQVRLVPWGDERRPAHPPEQPWPGRLPAPSPATVVPPAAQAPRAEVLDDTGSQVGVTARALLTATPHRVAVAGRPPRAVLGWAGPWPVEERWWEPAGGRRLARLQVVLDGGPTRGEGSGGSLALLLVCENGSWSVEGVYD